MALVNLLLPKPVNEKFAFLFANPPHGRMELPRLFALCIMGSALQCTVTTRDRLYGLNRSGTRNRLVLVHTWRESVELKLTCVYTRFPHP